MQHVVLSLDIFEVVMSGHQNRTPERNTHDLQSQHRKRLQCNDGDVLTLTYAIGSITSS